MLEIHNNDGTMRVEQYNRPYVNPRPGAGVVRYNTENQCLEAYDGVAWVNLTNRISVDLDEGTKYLLSWVERKQAEDQEIERLCAQYPNLAEARREFEILKKLVQDVDRKPK